MANVARADVKLQERWGQKKSERETEPEWKKGKREETSENKIPEVIVGFFLALNIIQRGQRETGARLEVRSRPGGGRLFVAFDCADPGIRAPELRSSRALGASSPQLSKDHPPPSTILISSARLTGRRGPRPVHNSCVSTRPLTLL